ncbi:MAG TPA: hypothetical protein DER09_07680 [Prolixibacteraceae bacterium]|nr:hypothetical protein [Prolixibacteraceae bacterium]
MTKLLKATHEGVLTLGNAEIDVAVLENGQRIVKQTGVFKALNRPSRGNARVIGIPVFMDAKNLQPFIDEELRSVISKVDYADKNGKIQQGFDANILPLVSDLYLKAREAGVITSQSQLETAKKAEILVRSLAKVAITALIDEATGYQYEREKDELQKILKKYISEELLPWEKRFPDEFYREIFKLNNWDFTVSQINKGSRPSIIGKWTKKYIYSVLPPGVLESLLQLTPRKKDGRLKHKLHQHLTREEGIEHLNKQIISTVAIMGVSKDWDDFEKLWNRKYGQQMIDFDFGVLEPQKEYSNFNTKLKTALDYNPKEEKPE